MDVRHTHQRTHAADALKYFPRGIADAPVAKAPSFSQDLTYEVTPNSQISSRARHRKSAHLRTDSTVRRSKNGSPQQSGLVRKSLLTPVTMPVSTLIAACLVTILGAGTAPVGPPAIAASHSFGPSGAAVAPISASGLRALKVIFGITLKPVRTVPPVSLGRAQRIASGRYLIARPIRLLEAELAIVHRPEHFDINHRPFSGRLCWVLKFRALVNANHHPYLFAFIDARSAAGLLSIEV
jgi:hypothetical protein